MEKIIAKELLSISAVFTSYYSPFHRGSKSEKYIEGILAMC